jgi:hypothetical protein
VHDGEIDIRLWSRSSSATATELISGKYGKAQTVDQ